MQTTGKQQKAKRIVAIGEILWDLLPAGPRLGGTTANFTIGCARLGRHAALISSLGLDTWGEQAQEVLEATREGGAELLETGLIQHTSAAPTGLVEVSVGSDGQPSYAIAMPAAWDEIQETQEAFGAIRTAQAVCFGTLGQRAARSRESIRQLVEATGPDCVRVLDVNVRMPFFTEEVARWSLSHATVVKISEEELEGVAHAAGLPGPDGGSGATTLSAIEACGRELLNAHPRMALLAITMGPRGSLLMTRTDLHYHPGFLIEVVDTVGAGDAFTAGLVHAWLAGASLSAVNEVGNLCGSFVASHPGATPVFSPDLLGKVNAALAA